MAVETQRSTRWWALADPGEPPTWWDWLLTASTVLTMVVAVLLRGAEARYPGTERLAFTAAAALPLVFRTWRPVTC